MSGLDVAERYEALARKRRRREPLALSPREASIVAAYRALAAPDGTPPAGQDVAERLGITRNCLGGRIVGIRDKGFSIETRPAGGQRTTGATEQARAVGMSEDTLRSRLRRGWPLDRALAVPVRPRRKSGMARLRSAA